MSTTESTTTFEKVRRSLAAGEKTFRTADLGSTKTRLRISTHYTALGWLIIGCALDANNRPSIWNFYEPGEQTTSSTPYA